jgi:hypothetical protein
MQRTHRWILYSALTAVILSGCAAGSGSPSFSGFLEGTKKAVVSAYETTKKTVVSTYNRITGSPADKTKEKAPDKSAGNVAGEKTSEGFPARSAPNYEEDIRTGRLRAITKPQVRGEGAKRIRVIPRDALGPGEIAGRIAEIDRELKWERDPRRKSALIQWRRELAEAREKNLKEERISREMRELRERLLGLESNLDKIRKSKTK